MACNICKHCGAVNKHFSFQCAVKSKKESIVKPKVKIKQFSDKKIKELAVYRKERDKYFKDHPICEFPECQSTDIQLHHSRGRCGSLLTDSSYFKSLCDTHHKFIENHPLIAKQLGLSADRL